MLETTGAEPMLQVVWHGGMTGTRIRHAITFELETSGAFRCPRPMVLRVLGHMLLSQLPDRGVEEACESLRQMYEFYAVPAPATPLPAPSPSIQARWGTTRVRPGFHITEE